MATITTFDVHPFRSADEYITMIHVIQAHPNSMTRVAAIDIVAILKRVDSRFADYSTADM